MSSPSPQIFSPATWSSTSISKASPQVTHRLLTCLVTRNLTARDKKPCQRKPLLGEPRSLLVFFRMLLMKQLRTVCFYLIYFWNLVVFRFLLQLVGVLLDDISSRRVKVDITEQQHTFYCQQLGTLLMCLIHVFKSGEPISLILFFNNIEQKGVVYLKQ